MLPFIDGYLHIKKWLIPCWNIDVKEYCRLIGSGHFKPWPDDQRKIPMVASKSQKEKKKKKNASVSKLCADMQTFGAVSSQLSVLLRKVILFWLV